MVENYDTQMIDYMADIDMQMHAFSSDPWLHDETKMEEDAPGPKPENFVQLKTDDQDRGDLTIEIDMEEHSAEYDMVDDDQIQHASATELLDVEVYDASLAHSPAMVPLDSASPAEPPASIAVSPKHQDTILPSPEPSLSTELLPPSVSQEAFSSLQEGALAAAAVLHIHEDVSHTDELPAADSNFHRAPSQDHVLQLPKDVPQQDPKLTFETEHFHTFEEVNAGTVNERPEEENKDPVTHSTPFDEPHAPVASDESLPSGELGNLEHVDEVRVNVESTSSGDPHEISEGVYIDPPPPVLLSIASEDLEFDHCFFNEPAEWLASRADQDQEVHRTILHHLPTLYYESLFTLFEALRQDEFIQSTFQLHSAELVLQAVDLALTITEVDFSSSKLSWQMSLIIFDQDNIYAREVSLHDLNMLHDASGILGPLRTRLCTSSPRFIARYQQLQENVSRLQLEQASREILTGIQTEVYDSKLGPLFPTHINVRIIPLDQQSLPVESSDHQEHIEQSHPYPVIPDGEEVGVNDAADELSETAEHEAHLPPQNSSEDENGPNTVAEVIQSPYEEESGLLAGNEGDNPPTQASTSNTEAHDSEPDSHVDGDESTSTEEHLKIQDEGQDGNPANSEGGAVVVGLEVLEYEASEQGTQEEGDQSERVSGHQQDDRQDEQEYADNTQDLEADVNDTGQLDAAESATNEGEEDTYEPAEEEDNHSHEHSEYDDLEGDLGMPPFTLLFFLADTCLQKNLTTCKHFRSNLMRKETTPENVSRNLVSAVLFDFIQP